MVTKELLSYIADTAAQGFTEDEIRNALLSGGWRGEDVAEGLTAWKEERLRPKVATEGFLGTQEKKLPITPIIIAERASPEPKKDEQAPSAKEVTLPPGIMPFPKGAPRAAARVQKPRKAIWIALIVLIVLIFGGGLGYAYTQKLWIFGGARYAPEELVPKLLAKLGEITSASYAVSVSLEDAPRDVDAKPLIAEFPEFEAQQPLYDRDRSRFEHLAEIRSRLNDTLVKKKKYPKTLAEAGVAVRDPSSDAPYEYKPSTDGKNYTLAITFETQEALDALKPRSEFTPQEPPATSGNTATFTNKSGEYSFAGKPKRPVLVELFANQEGYLDSLPGDIAITLRASGTTEAAGTTTDARFSVGGDIKFGDLSAAADLEFLKKNDASYVRINKFPNLFFDVSAIKEKWIKITKDDLETYDRLGFFSMGISQFADENRTKGADLLAQARLFFRVVEEESALIVRGARSVAQDGEQFYQYELALDEAKLPVLYRRLADEFKNAFGENTYFSFDERTAAYLESPGVKNVIAYFKNNAALTLSTDAKTGYPRELSYTFRVVPDEKVTRLKGAQFVLTARLALRDINTPSPGVVPPDSLSFDDAAALLLNKSKEELMFERQERNIEELRSALDVYHTLAGVYPKSLGELMVTSEELAKLAPQGTAREENGQNNAAKEYLTRLYASRKILGAVPNNVFTQEAYGYAMASGDYTITYPIRIPPFASERGPYYGNTYVVGIDPGKNASKLIEKYAEGTNTATRKTLSQEAEAQSKIDADKDGVSDALEAYAGTDKNKKDTDGDGKSDFEELRSRDNPARPPR